MGKKVLVAYATKYGATTDIAERIGAVLSAADLPTDVLPVKGVNDLIPYMAIILGSAVYIGRWRKEAAKFIKTNQKALTERPLWLFSSGPTGEGDPVELLNGWRFPSQLQSLAERIQPRDITVFHGNVDLDKLNFLHKSMIKNVQAPIGDYRDWAAITSWATSIADTLKETNLAAG